MCSCVEFQSSLLCPFLLIFWWRKFQIVTCTLPTTITYAFTSSLIHHFLWWNVAHERVKVIMWWKNFKQVVVTFKLQRRILWVRCHSFRVSTSLLFLLSLFVAMISDCRHLVSFYWVRCCILTTLVSSL